MQQQQHLMAQQQQQSPGQRCCRPSSRSVSSPQVKLSACKVHASCQPCPAHQHRQQQQQQSGSLRQQQQRRMQLQQPRRLVVVASVQPDTEEARSPLDAPQVSCQSALWQARACTQHSRHVQQALSRHAALRSELGCCTQRASIQQWSTTH